MGDEVGELLEYLRKQGPHLLVKSGWVEKQPIDHRTFNKRWRPKWMELHPHVICWFNEPDSIPRGYLLLSNAETTVTEAGKLPNVNIEVTTASGRKLRMRVPEGAKEHHAWVGAIEGVLRVRRQGQRQGPADGSSFRGATRPPAASVWEDERSAADLTGPDPRPDPRPGLFNGLPGNLPRVDAPPPASWARTARAGEGVGGGAGECASGEESEESGRASTPDERLDHYSRFRAASLASSPAASAAEWSPSAQGSASPALRVGPAPAFPPPPSAFPPPPSAFPPPPARPRTVSACAAGVSFPATPTERPCSRSVDGSADSSAACVAGGHAPSPGSRPSPQVAGSRLSSLAPRVWPGSAAGSGGEPTVSLPRPPPVRTSSASSIAEERPASHRPGGAQLHGLREEGGDEGEGGGADPVQRWASAQAAKRAGDGSATAKPEAAACLLGAAAEEAEDGSPGGEDPIQRWAAAQRAKRQGEQLAGKYASAWRDRSRCHSHSSGAGGEVGGDRNGSHKEAADGTGRGREEATRGGTAARTAATGGFAGLVAAASGSSHMHGQAVGQAACHAACRAAGQAALQAALQAAGSDAHPPTRTAATSKHDRPPPPPPRVPPPPPRPGPSREPSAMLSSPSQLPGDASKSSAASADNNLSAPRVVAPQGDSKRAGGGVALSGEDEPTTDRAAKQAAVHATAPEVMVQALSISEMAPQTHPPRPPSPTAYVI